MPTASGRETADEKRERQRAQAYDRMTVAIAKLDQAWIETEAIAWEAAYAMKMSELFAAAPSGKYVPSEVSRDYATETEAHAVYRAIRDRGSVRPHIMRTFVLAAPDGPKPWAVTKHASVRDYQS